MLEKLASSFDQIINTVSSADIDINGYLKTLRDDGTMVNVSASSEPVSLEIFSLVMGRRPYAGSPIGGIKETQEMLDSCAKHKIGAEIEVISAEKIDDAHERILNPDVRYRFVIDTSTL